MKCYKSEELFFVNWWKKLTKKDILNHVNELEECALFGIPFNSEKEVLNYYILYNQILHLLDILKGNNKPDLYACHIKLNSTYVKRIRP